MKRDYPGLDLVRFGSALLVTFYHLTYMWWLPANGADPNGRMWLGTASLHSMSRWGWVGVQVFFVLSGFVISFTAEGKDAIEFIKNRVVRLYPAAWFCATSTLVLSRWGDVGATGDYVRSLTLSPVGPWIDGPYWTLAIELMFYICVFVTLMFKVSLNALALFLSTIGCIFPMMSIVQLLPGQHFKPLINLLNSLPMCAQVISLACPFFGLGMLFWSLSKPAHPRTHNWLFCATALSCLFQLLKGCRFLMEKEGETSFIWTLPALIWLFAMTMIAINVHWHKYFSLKLSSKRASLRTLGLMTYPLYLLHSRIGKDLSVWASHYMSPIVAVGLATLLVVTLASLILRLEQIPRAMLKRLLWPRSKRTMSHIFLTPDSLKTSTSGSNMNSPKHAQAWSGDSSVMRPAFWPVRLDRQACRYLRAHRMRQLLQLVRL